MTNAKEKALGQGRTDSVTVQSRPSSETHPIQASCLWPETPLPALPPDCMSRGRGWSPKGTEKDARRGEPWTSQPCTQAGLGVSSDTGEKGCTHTTHLHKQTPDWDPAGTRLFTLAFIRNDHSTKNSPSGRCYLMQDSKGNKKYTHHNLSRSR